MKAPDDRYTSARGVRADFSECLYYIQTVKMSHAPEVSACSFQFNNISYKDSMLQAIPLFPLAQHDVASIFTLPKAIYGHQDVIEEMKRIIERFAGLYRSSRFQHRFDTSLALQKQFIRVDMNDPLETISGNASDTSSNYDIGESHENLARNISQSSNAPDTSDSSTKSSRVYSCSGSRIETTIVGLYGSAGTGKLKASFTHLLCTLNIFNQTQVNQHFTVQCNRLLGDMGILLIEAFQINLMIKSYVAIAKFDSRTKVPYATVLRSLSQVLQQVLSESEDEVHQFYDHIKMSLNAQFGNIALLTDIVPELKPLLLSAGICTGFNHTVQMDNIEAKLRFHKVFVEVFRAIALWKMTSLVLYGNYMTPHDINICKKVFGRFASSR